MGGVTSDDLESVQRTFAAARPALGVNCIGIFSQAGGSVRGYKRAIFSGFTTRALAKTIAELITRYPNLSGLRHLAAAPISKFDLLCLIRDIYQIEVEIEPDEAFFCDRSLD